MCVSFALYGIGHLAAQKTVYESLPTNPFPCVAIGNLRCACVGFDMPFEFDSFAEICDLMVLGL